MFKTLLLVGAGGFAGSVLRYITGLLLTSELLNPFPWATLLVNVAGSLLIGLLIALSLGNVVSAEWRLFLATGFCGGFTTFSAFSFETMNLLTAGKPGMAILYVAASIILGLTAVYLGYILVNS